MTKFNLIRSLSANFILQRSNSGLIHPSRFRNCRYLAGITAKPINDFAFRVSVLKRCFHATGMLYANDRDYYDILGVSTVASRDEIRTSFYKLAKKYHPDANKNCSSAKWKFQEIRDAYETLHDSEKRAHYDMNRDMGSRHNFGRMNSENVHDSTEFSSLFHKMFTTIFDEATKTYAPSVQVELLLSFQEAVKGCTKHLSYDAYVPCDSCHGRGYPIDAKTRTCPFCDGTGTVRIPPFLSTCSSCKGSGRTITERCKVCKAAGVLEGVKEVTVAIPAGVDSGDTIDVPEAGNSGEFGAQPGNLHIRLKVANDPVFTRSGADVSIDAKISFTQAMLGGKVEIPTLSGNIFLDIPKGVQPGQVVLLGGRGLPRHGFLLNRGDQRVFFRVNFPMNVNKRQKAILEEFEMEEINREQSVDTPSSELSWWQQILERRNGSLMEVSILLLILFLLTTTML